MIAAAFQYSGLGIILGMLLVTAVVVLCERPDDTFDDADERPSRGPACPHPTYTSQRTDYDR